MSESRLCWDYTQVIGEVIRRLEDKEVVSLRQTVNAYGCHDGSILVESKPNKEMIKEGGK